MNIFRYEFKSAFKSTVTWTLSLGAGAIVFFSMFPAFTKDIETSQKILGNFPPALRDALGLSLSSFFTIFGFYTYFFTFIALAGAIQAMNLGVGIISKEMSGKTVDFLLTKPVRRAEVLTSKLLAALASLMITNSVFTLISYIAAKVVATESFSSKIFVLISMTMFLIQLFFLALGSLFAVSLHKIKSVIAVSLPTAFTFFIIGTLGAIIGNDNVRYVTPFKFYDFSYIINNGRYEGKFLILEAVFVGVMLLLSYFIYRKKDIPSAT